jgi:hypothetical protein
MGAIQSPNYRANLYMRGDGNLLENDENGFTRWASNTVGCGYHARFQTDGNLVVYSVNDRPCWASNTTGLPGPIMAVQDDGNVVIYPGASWATNTVKNPVVTRAELAAAPWTLNPRNQILSPHGGFNLIMQSDGNLVLYDYFAAIWASNTVGRGHHAVFQTDGNLVVYAANGTPVWASNTCCRSGSVFMVQDDGNAVIYNGAAWATNTAH